MAFSSKFGKAKAAPAPPPPANDEDSDEVESVEADEDASARQAQAAAEAEKRRKEAEDAARAKALADAKQQAAQRDQEKRAAEDAARRKTMEEAQRRREAAEEARRKVEEDKKRKEEYEYEKARQETIARSKREAAKRAMGPSGGGGFGGGGFGGGGGGGGGGGSFAWKKSAAKPQGGAAPAGQKAGSQADMPSHDDCEMGISAMISRTTNGMKEGLQMLGLPIFPLVFIPGQELKLCGHDVREGINEMIHNWMTDEKEDFFHCLAQLKDITSNPILTQDEMEMMDNPEAWVQIAGPDGKPRFMRKDKNPDKVSGAAALGSSAAQEESDDEVIDLPGPGGGGGGLPAAAAAPAPKPAPAPTPAPPQPAAAPVAAAPPQDDYYGLLGVAQDATLHEIRSKFRALVVTEHPEKGGDPKKFQKLNKAYSVLSDQKKRQEYDESRRGGGARQKTFVD